MGDEIRLGRHRGVYCIVIGAGQHRQRRSLGTTDRGAALAAVAEFKRHQSVERAGGHLTVAGIYEAYRLNRAEEGKPATARIADAWKRLGPTFGPLEPLHVTEDLCRHYIAERRKVASDGTIHTELGYLRSAMRFARLRKRWLTVEPYIPMPPKPPPRDHHLTRDEARKLIDGCASHHVRLFVILGLTTAGRAGALLELTWDRVDFPRRRILLRNPERAVTRKGRAVAPMNDMALQALQEARAGALTPFVIEWGGKPVRSVKKAVARAAERAGVEATPHVLRHTAAVWLAEAGVPMEEIAQLLGHDDVRTTRRVYARYSPDYLMGAARALEL